MKKAKKDDESLAWLAGAPPAAAPGGRLHDDSTCTKLVSNHQYLLSLKSLDELDSLFTSSVHKIVAQRL